MTDAKNAILLDFGSTHTKMVVVSLADEKIIHTCVHKSTVKTDARIALEKCLQEAKALFSKEEYSKSIKLSSSSAAGGLKMAVLGISKNLSVSASRNTAFGAGAKILHTFTGKLKDEDIESLLRDRIEILLFCGGYENGNQSILIHNAELLAGSKLQIPIIYAGNSSVSNDVRLILTAANKECYIVNNVIPRVGVIDTESAEKIVRDIFLKRIVNAKGLSKVKKQIDGVLMPTPSAVLSAGELLSLGTDNEPGLGELIIVDVGGATTDVHSYASQRSYNGARIAGTDSSYAKRTVESDLGVRESAQLLVREAKEAVICKELGMSLQKLQEVINHRVDNVGYIPVSEQERKIDRVFSKHAVRISSGRHAGKLEFIHSANCRFLQRGKNLKKVRTVVGTGGPIINSMSPESILENVSKDSSDTLLLPDKVRMLLDEKYILYSMGLLRESHEDIAIRILKKNLRYIGDCK